jgi:hypothetical protein
MANVKVTTLRERVIDRAITVGATLLFAVAFFGGHAMVQQKPDPQIVMAEQAKAIRCIPADERTTCVMKRNGKDLEAELHVDRTDKRVVLMQLHDPIKH